MQISIKTLQSYNSLTVIQDAYLKIFQLPKPISAAIILTNLPIPTNLRHHIASPKSSRMAINTLFSVSAHPSPSITIAKSKDEAVNIIQRMNNLFVLFFFWITSKYHNYKVPKKEQAIISKRWTTSLLCSFPEQSPNYHNCKIQRMDKNLFGVFLSPVSNQFGTYVYCEQPEHCHTKGWATSMFVIPCEQPPIFSLKFFSKLEIC